MASSVQSASAGLSATSAARSQTSSSSHFSLLLSKTDDDVIDLARWALLRCQSARQNLATAELRHAFDEQHRRGVGSGRRRAEGGDACRSKNAAFAASSSSATLPCTAAMDDDQRRALLHAQTLAADRERKNRLDPLARVERQLAEEKALYRAMHGLGDMPVEGNPRKRGRH